LPHTRSDFDQAARYVQGALEILDRDAFAHSLAVQDVLNRIVRQLSPGDHFVGLTGRSSLRDFASEDCEENAQCRMRRLS
jgi:hypothetical protein